MPNSSVTGDADMSNAFALERVESLGSGTLAAPLPFDQFESFDDLRLYEVGYVAHPTILDARAKCMLLERARVARVTAIKGEQSKGHTNEGALRVVTDRLAECKAEFTEAIAKDRKEARVTAANQLDADIDSATREISALEAVGGGEEVIRALQFAKSDLQKLRSEQHTSKSSSGRYCCGLVTRSARVAASTVADDMAHRSEEAARELGGDAGSAGIDAIKALAGTGNLKLFWTISLGLGRGHLIKANLLAQKRQLSRVGELLSALRDTTVTVENYQEHIKLWMDLRYLEQSLRELDRGGDIAANAAVLTAIELVLHPHSEATGVLGLNENVWGTPLRGIAAITFLEPWFRSHPPSQGLLLGIKTIGRRLHDPGFPAIVDRLEKEEAYIDALLDVHARVANAFSHLVLSSLFGVATFLANVAFAASDIEETV